MRWTAPAVECHPDGKGQLVRGCPYRNSKHGAGPTFVLLSSARHQDVPPDAAAPVRESCSLLQPAVSLTTQQACSAGGTGRQYYVASLHKPTPVDSQEEAAASQSAAATANGALPGSFQAPAGFVLKGPRSRELCFECEHAMCLGWSTWRLRFSERLHALPEACSLSKGGAVRTPQVANNCCQPSYCHHRTAAHYH